MIFEKMPLKKKIEHESRQSQEQKRELSIFNRSSNKLKRLKIVLFLAIKLKIKKFNKNFLT